MLRSETLFGKREAATPTPAFPHANNSNLGATGASSASRPSTPMPGAPSSPVQMNSSSTAPNLANTSMAPKPSPTAMSSTNEIGSKLIVGPNIKLKGVEITDCDTLVVEGNVEATMDSRVIQIAECGAFKGSAEIDIAEIHGVFDGDLTVRQKLVIYATGRVSGNIRYGKVVIEEGGQLTGDVQVGTTAAAKGLPMAKTNVLTQPGASH